MSQSGKSQRLVLLVTSSSYIYRWSSLFIGLTTRKCFNRRSQGRILKVTGVKQLHAEIFRCVHQILGKDIGFLMYKFLNILFLTFFFFGNVPFSKLLLSLNASMSQVKTSCHNLLSQQSSLVLDCKWSFQRCTRNQTHVEIEIANTSLITKSTLNYPGRIWCAQCLW